REGSLGAGSGPAPSFARSCPIAGGTSARRTRAHTFGLIKAPPRVLPDGKTRPSGSSQFHVDGIVPLLYLDFQAGGLWGRVFFRSPLGGDADPHHAGRHVFYLVLAVLDVRHDRLPLGGVEADLPHRQGLALEVDLPIDRTRFLVGRTRGPTGGQEKGGHGSQEGERPQKTSRGHGKNLLNQGRTQQEMPTVRLFAPVRSATQANQESSPVVVATEAIRLAEIGTVAAVGCGG